MFFDLSAAGLLDGRALVLTDINPDVVGCYLAVRDDLDAVMTELHALAQGHAARGATHYYEIREERFNPLAAHTLRVHVRGRRMPRGPSRIRPRWPRC